MMMMIHQNDYDDDGGGGDEVHLFIQTRLIHRNNLIAYKPN
jgi:hypothetical protein